MQVSMLRPCVPSTVVCAVALLCAALGVAAHAAEAIDVALPAPAVVTLPEVRVTGSWMPHLDAETALPMVVLRRADIDRASARTVAELLQSLPIMQGSVLTSASVGNETHGYASASIHDLSDAYTLVLLNGQRTAPFAGQATNGAMSGVDLNTLPLAMVDRIEVLTTGATAIYGADALAGVVNIITRRDADANEATLGLTVPRSGALEWRLSAFKSVGNLEQSQQNLSLGASAMHRSALQGRSRAFANQAVLMVNQGGQAYRYVDGAAYSTAPGNAYDANVWINPYASANGGACPAGQTPYQKGLCLYNVEADLDLVPEQTQQSLMASYTRDVAPGSRWAVDLLLSRSQVVAHTAPMPFDLAIPASSPLYATYLSGLGFTGDPAWAQYRFADVGRRATIDTSSLADLAMRLQGRTHGWTWQGALKASANQVNSALRHSMGQQSAQNLIDSGSAFDPFASTQSAAGVAALRAAAYDGNWMHGLSTLYEAQGHASRPIANLAGGDLTWVAGMSARQEALRFTPSDFAQGLNGNLRIGDDLPAQASQASRTVLGVFTELAAPITTHFNVDGALRLDHDSSAGSAMTGQARAHWHATPTMLWRASAGTGFRSPTLNQLRAPLQSGGQTTGQYECTPALQAAATQRGAVPCSMGTNATSYPVVQGGNAELRPERSLQAEAGLRIEPIPGHVLGVDVWAVHIRHQVGVDAEQAVFAQPLVVPNAWTVVDTAHGRELALNGHPMNMGTMMASGVDIEASVRRASGWGLFDSRLLVSTTLREDGQAYLNGPWTSAIGDNQYGGAVLRWKAHWRTSLTRTKWTHTLTLRYQSGYDDAAVSLERLDTNGAPTGLFDNVRLKVPGQMLCDWQSTWKGEDGVWQISVGVVNVLNTPPPLSGLSGSGLFQGQMTGYDQRYFDARGRLLQLEAKMAF